MYKNLAKRIAEDTAKLMSLHSPVEGDGRKVVNTAAGKQIIRLMATLLDDLEHAQRDVGAVLARQRSTWAEFTAGVILGTEKRGLEVDLSEWDTDLNEIE